MPNDLGGSDVGGRPRDRCVRSRMLENGLGERFATADRSLGTGQVAAPALRTRPHGRSAEGAGTAADRAQRRGLAPIMGRRHSRRASKEEDRPCRIIS